MAEQATAEDASGQAQLVELAQLPVPGDRAVYVAHAPVAERRALIYLHGVCGDVFATQAWLPVATRHVTFIALMGDAPCPGGKRYRWSRPTAELDTRIRQALATVKRARSGQLDTDTVVLMGYSQGAVRAEALVARFPELYRYVVLGGVPTQPSAQKLSRAAAVAFVSGEREPQDYARHGARALSELDRPARFFVLPGAGHGQYGPRAPAVMAELFEWLLSVQ